jgi:hypothetical protein
MEDQVNMDPTVDSKGKEVDEEQEDGEELEDVEEQETAEEIDYFASDVDMDAEESPSEEEDDESESEESESEEGEEGEEGKNEAKAAEKAKRAEEKARKAEEARKAAEARRPTAEEEKELIEWEMLNNINYLWALMPENTLQNIRIKLCREGWPNAGDDPGDVIVKCFAEVDHHFRHVMRYERLFELPFSVNRRIENYRSYKKAYATIEKVCGADTAGWMMNILKLDGYVQWTAWEDDVFLYCMGQDYSAARMLKYIRRDGGEREVPLGPRQLAYRAKCWIRWDEFENTKRNEAERLRRWNDKAATGKFRHFQMSFYYYGQHDGRYMYLGPLRDGQWDETSGVFFE